MGCDSPWAGVEGPHRPHCRHGILADPALTIAPQRKRVIGLLDLPQKRDFDRPFFRFFIFRLSWEASTFENYNSEDSRDSGSRKIEFSSKSTTFLDQWLPRSQRKRVKTFEKHEQCYFYTFCYVLILSLLSTTFHLDAYAPSGACFYDFLSHTESKCSC